jgi:hypothetical protein|tara:strand:- start:604 stop:720 length:117 start_codon:yes stop_codon:yes gene_type:complete
MSRRFDAAGLPGDAYNLLWKHAYVVRGVAPVSILDTYH